MPSERKASAKTRGPGRLKVATAKRKSDATNDVTLTYWTNGSSGARITSIRPPKKRRRATSANQASAPRRPVVTSDVGMKPIPEEKSRFQKTVELRVASRYLSHSVAKVPGPDPNKGEEA